METKFIKEKLKTIKAFVFDVDGVFTNTFVYIDANGQQMRTTNAKDGYAVHQATKLGIPVFIVTGGKCGYLQKRFQDLGIPAENIFVEVSNKLECVQAICKKHKIRISSLLYMGDDIPDFMPMTKCGLAACPADAANEIISISSIISEKNGGMGCVRDIIEQTLRAKGLWLKDLESFNW